MHKFPILELTGYCVIVYSIVHSFDPAASYWSIKDRSSRLHMQEQPVYITFYRSNDHVIG